MNIITDSDIHDGLCQICIDSPHSLLSGLPQSTKDKIMQTTVCIAYKKGDAKIKRAYNALKNL